MTRYLYGLSTFWVPFFCSNHTVSQCYTIYACINTPLKLKFNWKFSQIYATESSNSSGNLKFVKVTQVTQFSIWIFLTLLLLNFMFSANIISMRWCEVMYVERWCKIRGWIGSGEKLFWNCMLFLSRIFLNLADIFRIVFPIIQLCIVQ